MMSRPHAQVCVQKGAEQKPDLVASAAAVGTLVSTYVFDRAPVNVILCDDQFKTVLAVPREDVPAATAKK
jgi:hypothetical protein